MTDPTNIPPPPPLASVAPAAVPASPLLLTVVPTTPAPPPPVAPDTNVLDFIGAAKKERAKSRSSANVTDQGYTQLPTILLWGQTRLGLEADKLNV